MNKLVMCKGLPGSGKTTWAKSQVSAVRVNKDDIRRMLEQTGWVWSREAEKDVIKERDKQIRAALSAGWTVISDDTNFGTKHEPRLRQLAKEAGADFEIKDFTDVPIEVCIERDSQREGKAKVGEKVILGMAEANGLLPKEIKVDTIYENSPTLPWCILCDLDGTLALKHDGRNIYDASTADLDIPNRPVLKVLEAFRSGGVQPVFCSGREEKYREPTVKFLDKLGMGHFNLYMRPTGDFRSDEIIKHEIFDREIRDKFHVLFVLDDRNRVVNMWRRSLGLTVFQVNEGDF